MQVLGILLFLAGAAGTAYSTWAIYHRGRPADVLFGILAPVAVLVAVLGLVLAFVPEFLG